MIEDDNVSLHFVQVLRIGLSLPNTAIVSLQRLLHLKPVDYFFSGNFKDKMLATYPCNLEDHMRRFDMI